MIDLFFSAQVDPDSSYSQYKLQCGKERHAAVHEQEPLMN